MLSFIDFSSGVITVHIICIVLYAIFFLASFFLYNTYCRLFCYFLQSIYFSSGHRNCFGGYWFRKWLYTAFFTTIRTARPDRWQNISHLETCGRKQKTTVLVHTTRQLHSIHQSFRVPSRKMWSRPLSDGTTRLGCRIELEVFFSVSGDFKWWAWWWRILVSSWRLPFKRYNIRRTRNNSGNNIQWSVFRARGAH